MILTEKEAAKKRCTPAIVLLLLDIERYNAQVASNDNVTQNCIGSRCMQWNWHDYASEKGTTFFAASESSERHRFHKGRASPGKEDIKYTELPARGYCGLATNKE